MITTLGELLIDYTGSGLSEAGMQLFEQNPGGAVANVAVAVSKLGYPSAFIGKVGADMQGDFLRQTLCDAGVDVSGLVSDADFFTTLAFVALSPSGERSFAFARKPGADTALSIEDIDLSLIKRAKMLCVGSLSLTAEPSRSATNFAVKTAGEEGVLVAYDPNYRASLWSDEQTAKQQMRSLIPYVDIMKISDEETSLLCDVDAPEKAAQHLLDRGVKIVTVTLGKKGALIASKNGMNVVEGIDLPAKDTTGAGDSFWGAFLYRIINSGKPLCDLTAEELNEFARFANSAATICVQQRGAMPAMPTLEAVKEMMGKYYL